VLMEFYPQAIKAFPHLKHHAATTILAAASTPGAGQKLTRRRVEALLHRCGRRNDTRLVDQILADLNTPALRPPHRVEAALGLTVEGLVAIVAAMRASVEQLKAELGREFETHPLAPVLRSAPGLGPVLAARLLAEVGDDPDRFTTANGLRAFAGTANAAALAMYAAVAPRRSLLGQGSADGGGLPSERPVRHRGCA
jgi:transposase